MKTTISTDFSSALELLKKGEVVALPTETVYGLAADALNPIAVAKIFEAKERPQFDPLIVHLPQADYLERVAIISTADRKLVESLIHRYWPGPLTLVLPKRKVVPDLVTAGLDTVAVRVSAHPILAGILKEFGNPLAAPSANRFGRISPTTAQHVFDELNGRIPLIVDAGPTLHGIESTIVAVDDGKICILRRGPITAEELSEFAIVETISRTDQISAPGQLPSHYAPRTPLRLVDEANEFTPKPNQRVALLAWNTHTAASASGYDAVRQLSESRDFREAAANLFRHLRELDQLGVDLIVAERVPDQGLGSAILDRLERASHRQSDEPGTPE